MSFFFTQSITEDGTTFIPTTAGYTLIVVLMLALLVAASAISTRLKGDENLRLSIKQITFSAMAIALATILSNFQIIRMPMGGGITLLSMFFITLIGTWYGLGAGITCGIAYGLLQLMIGPYIISFPQLLVDYVLAFGALGLSGAFSGRRRDYIWGYLFGILGRFVFSVLSGVIFFAAYAPESGILSNPLIYSAAYNGAYIFAEGAITIAVLSIPSVNKSLDAIREMAR